MPSALAAPERAPNAGAPRYLARGEGAWVEDVDGNRYVDLVGEGGAMVLGHGAARVVEAMRQTACFGLGAASPTTPAVLLAEQLRERIAPVDKVAFAPSHGAASDLALRLARTHTGRRRVIAFAGCYHGRSDQLLALAEASDGATPATLAASPDLLVLPYGDPGAVAAAFAAQPGSVAAVIVEAAPMHMGVIPAPIGFNAQLAKLCHDHGALFVFDEAVTGFRASARGMVGLEAMGEGWAPDLIVFGHVIGGGLPLGAVGGQHAVLDLLAQPGLLGGTALAQAHLTNPIACAAGLATLSGCDADLYRRLATHTAALQELVSQELDAAGVPHQVQGAPNALSVSFGEGQVKNLADARAKHAGRYRVFAATLAEGGVYAPPSPFAAWFVSGAHDERTLEHIAAALPAAARAAAKATRVG